MYTQVISNSDNDLPEVQKYEECYNKSYCRDGKSHIIYKPCSSIMDILKKKDYII